MHSIECVVVGAGVIGLAVARELAMHGREVLVLEAERTWGTATSSRNSGVIHAGIYYPKGSLKARLCVAGREPLYAFCDKYGVEHRRCGKLIVATTEVQQPELERIRAAAYENGVELALLDAAEVRRLEPALNCIAALYSPMTGIIDSHSYMLALLGQAEQHGATLSCGTRVGRLWLEKNGVTLALDDETRPSLHAKLLINCAGLEAVALARRIDGFPVAHVPEIYFAKGNYFALAGKAPFTHLVYPVPQPGGLGTHLTLDLAGQARFGPDVEWVDALDYGVDAERVAGFYAAIRAYWPALRDGALTPAYSGIRPKLSGPGAPAADFRIDGPATHGIRGVIHLFGIESPGLTASLAIARHVSHLIDEAA